ncbi:MarR family winged helix-turn-helix transcriptional regulator [Cohnella nanjingensis]|uniref:MarR family transcriptional regulator n=1 Tax=Cohnella nanjingensis TaxID=1387779 RepID=A0A7X0RLS2_9BACL|nr:MarR family transcriptional regulator [Cohnella nanjingensis]MBB6669869.1 MarR family transcriptional regulator [Cohnella nanjingensis]
MQPFPDSLTHLMRHVLKQHRREVDRLIHEYEVYPGQPPVLFRLCEQDGLSQRELAQRVRLTPATLTVMLTRMEKTGLVERRPDDRDQRISRVYMTAKGRAALDAVGGAIRSVEQRAFAGFLPEEQLLLRRLLMQMQHNLDTPDSLADE